MKKLILILSILAAPLLANAEADYTLTLEGDGSALQADDVRAERHYSRSFDFGRVWVGQRRVANFVLEAGRVPVRVHGMNVQGHFFDGGTNCPSLLFPHQRCIVRASYWPRLSGHHHGRLRLWVGNDMITVHLFGRAVR